MKEEIEEFLYEKIAPYREEKKRKGMEDRKTYEGVFDKRTLLAFYKLLKRGSIIEVEFPISTGKEGDVFRGIGAQDYVAIKVYRMTTANYRGLSRFIDGDDRFAHIHKTKDTIILVWAQKEFRNLKDYHKSGVRVPRPIDRWKNIIVMEYIGDETMPAPLMKEVMESLNKEIIYEIIGEMKKMYEAKLIHGDLSEYNILVWDDEPYIIDVGQAVPIDHPLADELLLRDLKNMVRVFKKMGVDMTVKELAREIGVV
jgi:RIO kinase 1